MHIYTPFIYSCSSFLLYLPIIYIIHTIYYSSMYICVYKCNSNSHVGKNDYFHFKNMNQNMLKMLTLSKWFFPPTK